MVIKHPGHNLDESLKHKRNWSFFLVWSSGQTLQKIKEMRMNSSLERGRKIGGLGKLKSYFMGIWQDGPLSP